MLEDIHSPDVGLVLSYTPLVRERLYSSGLRAENGASLLSEILIYCTTNTVNVIDRVSSDLEVTNEAPFCADYSTLYLDHRRPSC